MMSEHLIQIEMRQCSVDRLTAIRRLRDRAAILAQPGYARRIAEQEGRRHAK